MPAVGSLGHSQPMRGRAGTSEGGGGNLKCRIPYYVGSKGRGGKVEAVGSPGRFHHQKEKQSTDKNVQAHA